MNIELRAEGRKLLGVVVRYGSPGEGGQEMFQAGAFRGMFQGDADVMLNVQHQRGRALARYPGTMVLHDSPTEMRMVATLPATRDADDVLTLVRARVLVGLSVGFVAITQRWSGDQRIIERAALDHIAVVDRPSYPDSQVDARAGGVRFWQLPGGYQGTGEARNVAHRRSSRVRRWL